ncbi:Uncharacterised protein [Klebsiella pneumoniae]|nr:Uncharacterised protein [Klebsiella pneumoniae]
MMSLWDALRMNMMISYQELVRTFPSYMTGYGGMDLYTQSSDEYLTSTLIFSVSVLTNH